MQRRGLLSLVVAAVVGVALAVLAVSRGDRSAGEPTSARALPGLADKLGEVAAIRLTRGTMAVNLRIGDRGWAVVDKGGYPADQERVRKLLLQLAELDLIEPKTDKPELLARLDLDDPANGKSTEIALQSRNGAVLGQIVVGRDRPSDVTKGETGVYVRKSGTDHAWLARGSFALGGDVLSWLDRRVVDIAPARVASVVLTTADGSAAILARSSADQPFAIDGPPADARPKPDAALAEPAGALDHLTLTDVRRAADGSIAAENTPTAAFTTFDGLVIGLRLSPPEAGDWLAMEVTGFGSGVAEAKALNDRLSPWVFQIPAARAKLLRMTLPDFLLPRGS